MVAVVGLTGSMDHMVLVETGVLGKALITARHSAHIWLLTYKYKQNVLYYLHTFQNCHLVACGRNVGTCVNPHVVFVVGGAGKSSSTVGFRAVVWPLTSVCSDVNLSNI